VRRSPIKPPPVLAGCRVTEYAVRDRSAKYSGRSNLFVSGKELGPVPRLAIVRDHQGKYLLLHCGRSWNLIGSAPAEAALLSLPHLLQVRLGLALRDTGADPSLGDPWIRALGGQPCSAQVPAPGYSEDVEQMVEGQGSRICDFCIRRGERPAAEHCVAADEGRPDKGSRTQLKATGR
jgi:hypothetical protein